MERKELNSLNEAVLQVSMGEAHKKSTLRSYITKAADDEVDSMVLEYFENYFDGDLNEDTSDEDIMEAIYDLVALTEAVLEATALSTPEGIKTRLKRTGKVNRLLFQKSKTRMPEGPRIDRNDKREADAVRAGFKSGMSPTTLSRARDEGEYPS